MDLQQVLNTVNLVYSKINTKDERWKERRFELKDRLMFRRARSTFSCPVFQEIYVRHVLQKMKLPKYINILTFYLPKNWEVIMGDTKKAKF